MQEQENVYVQTEGAEQGMCMVTDNLALEKNGSAALGKFKDVNALLQAYRSLQAEFTRRSQRLKRLEEEAKRYATFGGETEKTTPAFSESEQDVSNADSSSSNALMEESVLETDAKQGQPSQTNPPVCDRSFAESAHVDNCQSSAQENSAEPQSLGVTACAQAAVDCVTGQETAANQQNADTTDTLYQRACADESVRLRIIGDYLSSIQKGGAPLMKGGAQAQPIGLAKTETIAQAGKRALVWLRGKIQEN